MNIFKINKQETIFDKSFLKLHKLLLSYKSKKGDIEIERYIVQKNHAVCVTLYDPEKELFLLLKEFRSGMIFDGDNPNSLGLAAGHIEQGENSRYAAKREVKEETGIDIDEEDLMFLAETYVSPGFTNEKHYHYLAKINIDNVDFNALLGVDDESIELVKISKDKVFEMIKNKEINNAYLVVGLLTALLEIEKK